jgi:hypothetical protein
MTDDIDNVSDGISVYSDDIIETLLCLESEFDDAIQELTDIHQQHTHVIERLQWIQEQPEQQNGIYTFKKGELCELTEMIKDLHEKSLLDIEESGHSTFCENLLNMIESSTLISFP